MKIIAAAALASAALLAAALPAAADDGPLDFGIFQGVNDTKGSNSTGNGPAWGQTDNGTDGTVPRSALGLLVERLV
ncbi:hypothetical protein [Streptomyces caeruleatus]|uniref:Uncharacterized protein n=1 Tax=Streptomyces caeruleatus TaxID=661399 RepID=A0A101TKP6_9ACTN|nr:hypothetical protein [Streptomyces caeruleatus]KUN94113.1 hypothetical protein AQJ67_37830 [Streptomyces caeruleatus]